MKHRTAFKKQYVDKKIRLSSRVYSLLILVMLGIVIYDSFVHILPFYYILYGLGGYLIDRIITLSQRVVLAEDKKQLSLEVHPIGKVITILLLFVRYFAGKIILEEFNVIWISDAIYLVFIGIYLSKVRTTFRQIDEQLYVFFFKETRDHNENKEA